MRCSGVPAPRGAFPADPQRTVLLVWFAAQVESVEDERLVLDEASVGPVRQSDPPWCPVAILRRHPVGPQFRRYLKVRVGGDATIVPSHDRSSSYGCLSG